MIVMCPWCFESDWFEDEDEDELYDEEEVIVEICDLCMLEDGLYFTLEDVEFCGYLQDAYLFCGEQFLREHETA